MYQAVCRGNLAESKWRHAKEHMEGKTRQDEARQDEARHGKAKQGKENEKAHVQAQPCTTHQKACKSKQGAQPQSQPKD